MLRANMQETWQGLRCLFHSSNTTHIKAYNYRCVCIQETMGDHKNATITITRVILIVVMCQVLDRGVGANQLTCQEVVQKLSCRNLQQLRESCQKVVPPNWWRTRAVRKLTTCWQLGQLFDNFLTTWTTFGQLFDSSGAPPVGCVQLLRNCC